MDAILNFDSKKAIPLITKKTAIVFLHQFLPYDPATKITKALFVGLKEYQLLLNAALEAARQFQQDNLERFDSLVGENACEIRAVRLALIATQKLVDGCSMQQRIADALEALQQLSPKKIDSLMLNKISLQEVLSNEKLTVSLTPEEVFLIQSFLLTESKEDFENDLALTLLFKQAAVPKKLKQYGDISSTFSYELVKKLRKDSSLDSVNFIRTAADTFDDELLQDMLSDKFTMLHHNCTCLPMFWANKPLLFLMLKEKIPLILHVKALKGIGEDKYVLIKETCLCYGHCEHKTAGGFVEIPQSKLDSSRPSIVFQGVVIDEDAEKDCFEEKWKNAMRSHQMADMILASAADHRQYPDSEWDQLICSLNDKEYQHYKNLSDRSGFSLKNPTLFFVQHIYTAQPKLLPFIRESVVV